MSTTSKFRPGDAVWVDDELASEIYPVTGNTLVYGDERYDLRYTSITNAVFGFTMRATA